jgi:hydrogenase large subunit
MVYKKLPIEIDARGQARLRAEIGVAPFSVARGEGAASSLPGQLGVPGAASRTEPASEHDRLMQEVLQNPNVRFFEIEPLTRSSERPSLRAMLDLEHRLVLDARVEDPQFRRLELVLRGRAPSDAVQLASRSSGSSSGGHAIAAAMAMEMACGVAPPPLGIVARGLAEAAELIYSHVRHLFLQAGPDYSEEAVSRTNSAVWARAQQALAPNAAAHGFRTIADVMRALNPMTGHLYREALHLTRAAMEVATLLFGKYPHPSTILIGGVGIDPDKEIFNQVLGRINRLIDYAKVAVGVWDDLAQFFYQSDERYRRVGAFKANLLSAGLWDDPAAYTARFERCNEWGERRWATPGVIIGGQLRTTRLAEINAGIEEFVDHSFFAETRGHRVKADLNGLPLSPLHPWNRVTAPAPAPRNWKEQYSWSTASRWDREPMETGPIARQWVTAMAGKLKNEFILPFGAAPALRPSGNGRGNSGSLIAGLRRAELGLELDLPKFQQPARKLRWFAPEAPNAFERNRARAYHLGYCSLIAFTYLLKAFDYLQRGEKRLSTWFGIPKEAIGAGFWENAAGALTHHVLIAGGRVIHYQIVPPSAWLSGPRDPYDMPGPYEQALINTPLLEEFSRPEDFTGIDLLRAIRSFDP